MVILQISLSDSAQGHYGTPHDSSFHSIERCRISDHVYEQLLRAIVEHRFIPGERLSIPKISRSLNVSQMPVRQALTQLNGEGFVDIYPNRGTFVAQADERDITEAFDIRRALDVLVARTAVIHVCDRSIASLEKHIRKMDGCAVLVGDGRNRHDRLDWEFHLLIVQLSGNKKLHRMYGQLSAHLRIARDHVSSRNWAARFRQAQAEHRAMVGALRDRSAEALATVLATHAARDKAAWILDFHAARGRSQ